MLFVMKEKKEAILKVNHFISSNVEDFLC